MTCGVHCAEGGERTHQLFKAGLSVRENRLRGRHCCLPDTVDFWGYSDFWANLFTVVNCKRVSYTYIKPNIIKIFLHHFDKSMFSKWVKKSSQGKHWRGLGPKDWKDVRQPSFLPVRQKDFSLRTMSSFSMDANSMDTTINFCSSSV